mmetsp:Transcript_9579/g.35108  ORF Transcript_9579/g.35108 Transcript_9579/m.35108 type:complete len:239 (+) Transcript_9579:109-825(+)
MFPGTLGRLGPLFAYGFVKQAAARAASCPASGLLPAFTSNSSGVSVQRQCGAVVRLAASLAHTQLGELLTVDSPLTVGLPRVAVSGSSLCGWQPSASIGLSYLGNRPRRNRRYSALMVPTVHTSVESETDYHRKADETLAVLQDAIELYLDQNAQPNCDVECAMGVLTIKLGTKGTYVLNKQAPNRQLWLSSPVSGPLRFDYEPQKGWYYKRTDQDLGSLLGGELESLIGSKIKLPSL